MNPRSTFLSWVKEALCQVVHRAPCRLDVLPVLLRSGHEMSSQEFCIKRLCHAGISVMIRGPLGGIL